MTENLILEKNESDPKERVHEIFKLARGRKNEKKKLETNEYENLSIDSLAEKLTENFPPRMKVMMEADLARWKGYLDQGKIQEEDVKEEIKIQAGRMRDSFIGAFGMPNKEFGKVVIINEVDRILENADKPENLRKIALVNMDLNGLKAVNDLGNHVDGDSYIRLAVKTVSDPELKNWAEERKLKITAIHDSGDEFSLIVVGEEEIKEKDLKELMRLIQEKIYNDQDAGKILDFKNDDVLYKLYEAEKRSGGEIPELKSSELIERLRSEIPVGFVFRAALSAGAVNLYDAISADKDGRNEIKDSDNYQRILEKIMGSLRSVSDDFMAKEKARQKIELAKSSDPKEKMLSRLYEFREAGLMKIKSGKEQAEKNLAARKEKEESARRMLSEGESPEKVLKFLGVSE